MYQPEAWVGHSIRLYNLSPGQAKGLSGDRSR
jgi:hypothetical protein